jgi:hypothetical protein
MTHDPSSLVMTILLTAIIIFLVCLVMQYRIVRSGISNLKGLEAGLKYSSELRRFRKEQPPTNAAKRLRVLDRVSLSAWLIGAVIILLWKLKLIS